MKIIEATKRIELIADEEEDGSRRIEFKIWGKKHKILDVYLKDHTDREYRIPEALDWYEGILLKWMRWNNPRYRW